MDINKLEEKAIKFIQTVANNSTQQLYAGNSGGKDSAVIDYLLQKSKINYISIYANSTVDPPGTLNHIKTNYPHTQIIQPEESMFQLIKRKGFPTRLNRYCCQYLKEYVSIGKHIFEGIRSAESKNRQNRDYIQCDNRKWQKGSKHIYPIYDWSDNDVWNFIKEKNITLAPSYNLGLKRLGCIACPLVSRKNHRQHELSLFPKFYNAYKKAIEIGMNNNPQWKLTVASNNNPELAMQWWLSNLTMNQFFKNNTTKINNNWININNETK